MLEMEAAASKIRGSKPTTAVNTGVGGEDGMSTLTTEDGSASTPPAVSAIAGTRRYNPVQQQMPDGQTMCLPSEYWEQIVANRDSTNGNTN